MDGSAYLYEGLKTASAGIAEGMMEFRKNRDESQFLDAQFDQMMKFAPQYGVQPDLDEAIKFSSGNLNAKRAAVSGLAMQMQMAQQKAQREAMADYRKEQMSIARQRLAVSEMKAQAGLAKEEEPIEHEFIEDPATGARFLGRGRTTLPSGQNPSKSKAPDAQVIKDEEGKPLFHALPTGKGSWTFKAIEGGEQPKPYVDPATMKIVPGLVVIGKQIRDLRTDLQKLGIEGEPEEPKPELSTNSKENPAKPTTQDAFTKLPKGTWFINPADGKLLQKK